MNLGSGFRRARRWGLLCGVSVLAAQGAIAAGASSALADPAALRDVDTFMLTTINDADDRSDAAGLGFSANWFGTNFTNVAINSNGRIAFGAAPDTELPFGMNTSLSGESRGTLDGFWSDLEVTAGSSSAVLEKIGQYTFGTGKIDGRDAFVATWTDALTFGFDLASDAPNTTDTFQIVLIDRSDTGADNFDIEFNFGKILANRQ